jgi:glycopeptide antibiotics resistance protein
MPSIGYVVPLALTLGSALAIVLAVAGHEGDGRSPVWSRVPRPVWVNASLIASVTGIATLTLNPENEVLGHGGKQLVPFHEILHALTSPHHLPAIVANILLFVPFGAALCLRGMSLRMTALTGFLLTSCVEGAQLLLVSGRTTSVDDVILNTLGVILGYALLTRWSTTRDT